MKTLVISLLAAFVAAFAHTTPLFARDKGNGPKHLHFEVEGVGFDMVFVDGGCWYFGPWSSRVTQRQGAHASTHYSNLGFRLALPKYYKM